MKLQNICFIAAGIVWAIGVLLFVIADAFLWPLSLGGALALMTGFGVMAYQKPTKEDKKEA